MAVYGVGAQGGCGVVCDGVLEHEPEVYIHIHIYIHTHIYIHIIDGDVSKIWDAPAHIYI